MDFFFEPRGIALIGATENPMKGGARILHNIMQGYKGPIYPVNKKYRTLQGLPCYASVRDVPNPVDLGIVFIPAAGVSDAVRDCARRGIRGVMVQSGGFSEIGAAGRRLQAHLRQVADETGVRVWGPNCMGLFDGRQKYIFSFMAPGIWKYGLMGGPLSLVVQSGMLSAGFLLDLMTQGRMGINKACSIGNKVDVEECELLEYLLADHSTGAVGLYLESIPDGNRFFDICRASRKPIVLLKGGRSASGADAAKSHTASLAGDTRVIRGMVRQAGIAEARDFYQMMDIGQALAQYPRPTGGDAGRVAVLTFSGGAGIVSADLLETGTLRISNLAGATLEKLKTVFPSWMPPANPVDLYPALERNGPQRAYDTAIRAVCEDPEVDAVFAHLFASPDPIGLDLAKMAEICRSSGKPLFVWILGDQGQARRIRETALRLGVPVFREIHRAVEAMEAVFQRWRFLQNH